MRLSAILVLLASCSPFVARFGGAEAPTHLAYVANPLVTQNSTPIAADAPSFKGGAPTSYVISPQLPPGLNLDGATGIITGTPVVTQAASDYVVTASNGQGEAQVTLNITVMQAAPALSFPGSPFVFVIGEESTTGVPSNSAVRSPPASS